jgi:hypothetical protein
MPPGVDMNSPVVLIATADAIIERMPVKRTAEPADQDEAGGTAGNGAFGQAGHPHE